MLLLKPISNDAVTGNVIYGVFGAIATISAVGNAFVVMVSVKIPALRKTTLSLIGNLAMADML
ncbi:predicted protein, partial [Nematostella vectensis]